MTGWVRRDSWWGIVGLAVMLAPVEAARAMAALGGPWPGDSGMQILGYAACVACVTFPLGLACAIIGLLHRGRWHLASLAAIAVAIATFAGFSGRDRSGTSGVTIEIAEAYLIVVLIFEAARRLLGPWRAAHRLDEDSRGIENVQRDRSD